MPHPIRSCLLIATLTVMACGGVPEGAPPASPMPGEELRSFYDPGTGDNDTVASGDGIRDAGSYQPVRVEGLINTTADTGMTPLKLYYHAGRGDNFTTATVEGEQSAIAAGYSFVRVEGYVFTAQEPGTVPLKQFYSSQREDNFATATADGEKAATASGYLFVRVEGYVRPAG